jgi:hypothetical protein
VEQDRVPKVVQNLQDGTETTWKQRYLDLKQKIRERDETESRLKRGVLDALVSTNHFAGA